MAVGDYSDNVLKEIDKNHDEVMFLYSMLNEKEKEVKNAVNDVENIKRSINVIADNEKADKAGKSETFANNQINNNIKNTVKKTISMRLLFCTHFNFISQASILKYNKKNRVNKVISKSTSYFAKTLRGTMVNCFTIKSPFPE